LRWITATGSCRDDPEAMLPDGRLFPRRAVFGRYVAAQLAPFLRDGRVIHEPGVVDRLEAQNGAWMIGCAATPPCRADIAILATGHTSPSIPAPLSAVSAHPRFIADPLQPGALSAIGREDRVLIIGTGLTMADIVASLDQAGHSGPIQAISRRGQGPGEHAAAEHPPYGDFASPPDTALGLVRRVRLVLAEAAADGRPWQSVFDALRCQAQTLWMALSETERRRLIRHARPYWEARRHRMPPATAAILRRRLREGTLSINAASIRAAQSAGRQIDITLRLRGTAEAVQERFDVVILTAGPGRITDAPQPLIGTLLKAGVMSLDCAGLGISCNDRSLSVEKMKSPPLFLAGPLARGTLAESISVPEISRQAASITKHIAAFEFTAI
jgi:uncharacterized NAD(P)/FAD-binding protein YdhS